MCTWVAAARGVLDPGPPPSVRGPSPSLAQTYPRPRGSTGQTAGHLSHTQGSHEGSPFSATRGRRGWQMPVRLQGQKPGLRRTPAAASLRLRGADAGDSPAPRPRSPAPWRPSSHPSASPAAPGMGKCFSGPGLGPCPDKGPSHSPSQPAPVLRLPSSLPQMPSLARLFILTCSSTPLMMSRGSNTFPRDLLIFRPCLSRTME